MSSTVLNHSTTDLIPLEQPRSVPLLAPGKPQRRILARLGSRILTGWTTLRAYLPTITSHRNALLDLADGYDRMARRSARRGDQIGAKFYRESAKLIREQIGLS